jgi:hypothetical protein
MRFPAAFLINLMRIRHALDPQAKELLRANVGKPAIVNIEVAGTTKRGGR